VLCGESSDSQLRWRIAGPYLLVRLGAARFELGEERTKVTPDEGRLGRFGGPLLAALERHQAALEGREIGETPGVRSMDERVEQDTGLRGARPPRA
jgi:hypothetical protein